MLYQELPSIESSPLDGWGRWLAPAVVLAAGASAALLLLTIALPVIAGAAVLAGLAGSAFIYWRAPAAAPAAEPLVVGPDYALLGTALGLSGDPVALTSGEGSVLLVNQAYRERFGGAVPPLQLAVGDDARQALDLAQTMAWRDGAGCVAAVEMTAGSSPVEVDRVGAGNDLLLWRFVRSAAPDPVAVATNRLRGRA